MSKLMELVERYGRFMRASGVAHEVSPKLLEDALSEIRAAVQELERDAARYRYLENLDRKTAQAFFWHYESRKQRGKAIDVAMGADKCST